MKILASLLATAAALVGGVMVANAQQIRKVPQPRQEQWPGASNASSATQGVGTHVCSSGQCR